MKGLKEQNTITDSISQQCSCSSINQWQKVCEGLPQNIFIFVGKEIILQLANNTNLFRLGLCNINKQTQLDMLNNCHEAVHNGRYTWRHEKYFPRWKILDSNCLLICVVLKILKFCLMVFDLIL